MISNFKNRMRSFKQHSKPESRETNDAEEEVSHKPIRNEYGRPCFLELTEEEFRASDNHETRPIIVPKSTTALPWGAGYAECVCTRVKQNEDQAAVGRFKLTHKLTEEQNVSCPDGSPAEEASLLGLYFGVFDGHGGTGAALMVADQLLNHLQEKLVDVRKELFDLALKEHGKSQALASGNPDHNPPPTVNSTDTPPASPYVTSTDKSSASVTVTSTDTPPDTHTDTPPDPPTLYDCVTFDDLVIGALEAAYHAMDEQIGGEKTSFNITGGCCTLLALFLHGKLYVANAGDCRAVVYKGDHVIPLSTDFSADQDAERIYTLARLRPELTQGYFSLTRFYRSVYKVDLGHRLLCKAPGARGWSNKEVTDSDINFPLIRGTKKRSRLMNCIGVSRSLGDHDLTDVYTKLHVKPFLSCTPEVQVLDLQGQEVGVGDVVVMGSDGLWDVINNQDMGDLVHQALDTAQNGQHGDRYTHAAHQVVLKARGTRDPDRPGWNSVDGEEPSHDDITAMVIPLAHAVESTSLTFYPFS